MSSIESLGAHVPVALPYLVQESILPPNPSRDAYKWDIYDNAASLNGEEEVVATDRCVVWSQGGLIKRVFRFDQGDDKVSQALLTWLPSNQTSKSNSIHQVEDVLGSKPAGAEAKPSSSVLSDGSTPAECLSRALFIFVGRQAHVNYSSGVSHIVRIPFELDKAFATPRGVLLQRKLSMAFPIPPTPMLPPPPQNSFWSSQPPGSSSYEVRASAAQPSKLKTRSAPSASATALQNLKFGLGQLASDLKPRMYSLTDPVQDIGLVVGQAANSQRERVSIPEHSRHMMVDSILTDEDMLYISSVDELSATHSPTRAPIMLALTFNKERKSYNLWQGSYIEDCTVPGHRPSPKYSRQPSRSRRRSSYGPRASTGATTPALRQSESARESFGGISHATQSFPPTKIEPSSQIPFTDGADGDLVTQLQTEIKIPGYQTATDRRTSSILARTELSAQDSTVFPDAGRSQPGIHGSFGAGGRKSGTMNHGERKSFGRSGRLSGRASSPGSTYEDAMEDILEDDSLEDLMIDDIHTSLGFHDVTETLRTEMTLTKIMTFATDMEQEDSATAGDPRLVRVFVVPFSSSSPTFEDQNDHLMLHIVSGERRKLLEVPLAVRSSRPKKSFSISITNGEAPRRARLVEPSKLLNSRIKENVVDAIKVLDGKICRALVLHGRNDTLLAMHLAAFTDDAHDIILAKPFPLMAEGDPTALRSSSLEAPRSTNTEFQHTRGRGSIDIVDQNAVNESLRITLQPRSPYVARILLICGCSWPELQVSGDAVYHLWWDICTRFQSSLMDSEWHGVVVAILTIALSLVGLAGKQKFNPQFQAIEEPIERRERKSSKRTRLDISLGSASLLCDQNRSWPWTQAMASSRAHGNALSHCVTLASKYMNERTSRTPLLDVFNKKESRLRWAAARRLLLGLHFLREEAKLDVLSQEVAKCQDWSLGPVVAQIGYWMGWDSWSWAKGGCYHDEFQLLKPTTFDISRSRDTTRSPPEPPTIHRWLREHNKHPQNSFPRLSDIFEDASPDDPPDRTTESIDNLIPRTVAITSLVSAASQTQISSAKLVEEMLDHRIESRILETMPEAIVASLRSAIVACQKSPPTTWPAKNLQFVDRQDLARVLDATSEAVHLSETTMTLTTQHNRDVATIFDTMFDSKKADGAKEVDTLSRLIFRQDRRIDEAMKLLNSARPAVAQLRPSPSDTEAEFLEKQKEIAQAVYMRTISLPSGQAVLEYSTRQPPLTEKIIVTGFTISCIIYPSGNTINADVTNFTEEKVCWAWFHAGVEAGLAVSRDSPGLDTSWFVLNKPDELGNRHAGMLLALGLNGHFNSMAKWLAFKYLTEKHNMTTVGLLIGLSASSLGTMDSLITKILSVHVQCLLPHGAADVNLSSITQTAGVMGIGLLYYNSQHRRMSEVMLTEIEHLDAEDASSSPENSFRTESYRLAAGFALGFINIGRGKDLGGLHDMRVLERLLVVATGPRETPRVHIADQATAGAIMAIIMIFMKSHDSTLARKIDTPATVEQFDYMRPDMLLLRKLAAKLIMWDSIHPTLDFIRDDLPSTYHHQMTLEGIQSFRTEDLPFFNLLGGLLWSIGLRYSGTGNIAARDLLLRYVDEVDRLMVSHLKTDDSLTWNQAFTHTMVTRFEHLVVISAAIVMAGTGDLNVFRRLRRMHGRINKRCTFGCHQAAHQAMGILFLGRGRYTFSTSNKAIASLLIAFYPLFPQDVLDNQSHLQALRHLWVLAAEARCLIPRDVGTNQPLVVAIRLTLRNGEIIESLKAPCLLPDVETIARVETIESGYWNVTLDFENNPQHVEAFRRHQSIWLKSKNQVENADNESPPALYDMIETSFEQDSKAEVTAWLSKLRAFREGNIDKTELQAVLAGGSLNEQQFDASEAPLHTLLNIRTTAIDDYLALLRNPQTNERDRLLGLELLVTRAEAAGRRGETMEWINSEKMDRLRAEASRIRRGLQMDR